MTDFGEIGRELIKRNLGEVRLGEICKQFGLSAADTELVNELFSKWKPDYTLEDIVALAENYTDRPNIGGVLRACAVIAREVAQISNLRRLHKDNMPWEERISGPEEG